MPVDLGRYPDELRMDEARAAYFAASGFGEDGGYRKRVDWFRMGPLVIPIPNPPSRVRALQYHDLHHVLTGYDTDWRGEFEIGGWELGGGCAREWFAWYINLGGFGAGILACPRLTSRAFYRGRHGGGLYGRSVHEILSQQVGEVRRSIGLAAASEQPSRADRRALIACVLAALAWGVAHLALALGVLAVLARLLAGLFI